MQEKHRINITKNDDPKDPSGGFILEFDHGQREDGVSWVVGNMYALYTAHSFILKLVRVAEADVSRCTYPREQYVFTAWFSKYFK